MISVIILTKNEEADLPTCLESVKWSNDVHVLDSGSTDNTINIAKQFGVNIWTNTFKSYGQQRNFALDNIRIKNDWILFLDADEEATDKFRFNVLNAIENAEDNIAGFYCCPKMMLEDKWLKYSDNFPKWQFRIIRKGKARWKDFGHGQKEDEIKGKIGYIKEPYIHYSFSKGWNHWIEKHNRYSTLEADSRFYNTPPFLNIFSKHSSMRNPALKSWLTKFPGWPLLRFLHDYFFKLGFIEGVPGYIYCVNIAYYEFLIQIKIRELKRYKRTSKSQLK
jgi:glycosyltransferase involved in cell wall biosynthesis